MQLQRSGCGQHTHTQHTVALAQPPTHNTRVHDSTLRHWHSAAQFKFTSSARTVSKGVETGRAEMGGGGCHSSCGSSRVRAQQALPALIYGQWPSGTSQVPSQGQTETGNAWRWHGIIHHSSQLNKKRWQ
eukprot:1158303-Pelagomonas_calceolata.AAC.6